MGYQEKMRSAVRFLSSLVLGVLGTGCLNSTIPGPGLKNVDVCSSTGAGSDVVIDNLPPWALERNVLAEWIGDDLVLAGGTPPRINVAIIDGATGGIRTLPLGTIDVPSPEANWQAYHKLVGKHVVSLWRSYAVPNVHGVVVNLSNGDVRRLSTSPAPRGNIFSTSPYFVATTQNSFVMWPNSGNGSVDLNAGILLDVQSGAWSSISANLGQRIGANVASLSDGRVIVWGGMSTNDMRRPLREGAILQLEEHAARPFQYPSAERIGYTRAARSGAQIAGAASSVPFLEGYVLDIDSGKTVKMPSVSMKNSSRNHSNAHFDGRFFLYIARDELWVFDVAAAKWKSYLMPFEPEAPSDISVHELEPGRAFIAGSSTGDYVFNEANGRFCSLPRPDKLAYPEHIAISRNRRALLGSVYFTGGDAPGCPPGAPCAVDPVQRVEDRHGVISVIP